MLLQKKRLSPIFIIVLSLVAAAANAQLINLSRKGNGFGNELVNLLVRQLEGKLITDNSKGNSITIHFKYTKPH